MKNQNSKHKIPNTKTNKGITLIALIITIIILLILAMVSIRLIVNGEIITKSKYAVNKYNEEQMKEKIALAYSEYKMGKYTGSTESFADIIAEMGITGTVTGSDTTGYEITVETKDGTKTYTIDRKYNSI